MTREEQVVFDRENRAAFELVRHTAAPAGITGYHISASREDAEVMEMAIGKTQPLSPGAIHRTYTVNEYGEVESVIPDDYRMSKLTMAAKITLLTAFLASVANLIGFACTIGR